MRLYFHIQHFRVENINIEGMKEVFEPGKETIKNIHFDVWPFGQILRGVSRKEHFKNNTDRYPHGGILVIKKTCIEKQAQNFYLSQNVTFYILLLCFLVKMIIKISVFLYIVFSLVTLAEFTVVEIRSSLFEIKKMYSTILGLT